MHRTSTMLRSEIASGARHRPSVLDLGAAHIYVPRAFFYRGAPDIERLEQSLRRVLLDYPELSGRLVLQGDEVMIECSDRGVAFEVIDRSGSLPDYGPGRSAQAELADYLPTRGVVSPGRDQPLMRVRVTRFRGGGHVLGVTTCHTLVDGMAFYGFMNAWMVAGDSTAEAVPRPTQGRDVVDRLASGSAPAEHPDYVVVSRLGYARVIARYLWAPRRLGHFAVRFEAERLAAMKAEAMAELSGSGRWVSTNDVLGGYLWRSLAQLGSSRAPSSWGLMSLQSMRHRLEPPLEPRYFGNCVFGARTSWEPQRLCDAPLHEVGLAIRELYGQATDERIRELLAYLVAQRERGMLRRTLPRGVMDQYEGHSVLLNDWSQFPIYTLDFGAGVPVWFEIPGALLPRLVIIAPTPTGQGRDVSLSLPRALGRALLDKIAADGDALRRDRR